MGYTVYRGGYGNRFYVQVDENPRYARVLMEAERGGGLDCTNLALGWEKKRGLNVFNEPRAALHFALVWRHSFIPKTESAMRALEKMMTEEMKSMSVADLTAEYNRISGRPPVKSFKSKAAAIKAIEKAATPNGIPAPKAEETAATTAAEKPDAAPAAPKPAAKKAAKKEEPTMAAAKKSTKKSSKTTTKKAAKPAAKKPATPAKKNAGTGKPGIGALIRQLIKDKLSNEEIVSAVLKKFPAAKTNNANVSWYRSQIKAGN